MAVTIKLKRDTAANWTSNNPTLAAGEMGIETDTNKFKFGDGSTAWTSLSYSVGNTNLPLNGLTDVAAQSPNDGDVIQYDSANSKWVTAAPASGGSYSDSDVSTFLNGNIDGHLIPDTNITYDLGSPTKKFRYLYLDSSTMFLGDDAVSSNGTTLQMNGQPIIGAVPTTATTPENPVSGDQWFDPATLTLYVYYVDANSVGAWVEVGGA